jgi:hypothetical protein
VEAIKSDEKEMMSRFVHDQAQVVEIEELKVCYCVTVLRVMYTLILYTYILICLYTYNIILGCIISLNIIYYFTISVN